MKNGIVNLMRHLKMLPGECKRTEITHRLSGDGNTDAGVSATKAGFLVAQVGILDEVNAGQLLGTLVDILGEPVEEYRAPAAGVIGLVREFPVVQAGDSLFLIAERER
jgi:predicted deacylase